MAPDEKQGLPTAKSIGVSEEANWIIVAFGGIVPTNTAGFAR